MYVYTYIHTYIYIVNLQRGTPEFFDGQVGGQGSNEQLRSHRSDGSSSSRPLYRY